MPPPRRWQPAPRKSPPPNFENDKVNPTSEGSRVIAVSFAARTKTALGKDGLTPEFANGDSILLVSYPKDSNEAPITEIRRVKIDKTEEEATISTNLTGDLLALYPAKYAKQMSNGKFGLPAPAIQTGKFADANFCGTLTPIKEGDESATFQNVTSLFIITAPTGTKQLTVKSLKKIGDDGQRTGERDPIGISENEEVYSISIPNGPDADGKYYVALHYGFNLSDLSFEAWFANDGSTGSIKGIPTSQIATQAGKDVIVGSEAYNTYNEVRYGTAYTISGSNWHEYVTVAGRKWATMNIGAETKDEYGEYFAWGETKGHTPNPDVEEYLEFEDAYPNGYGFGCSNYLFNGGKTEASSVDFETAKATAFPSGRLVLQYDAAYSNWGGAWRMPIGGESGEFQTLKSASYIARDETNGGYYVFLPDKTHLADGDGTTEGLSTSDALLFFPAAGIASGNSRTLKGEQGYYWSNTLGQQDMEAAFLYLGTNAIKASDSWVCWDGCSIRAIIDDPDAAPAPTPTPAPAEHEYVEIGTLKWATCNIGADSPTDYGWYFSWGNTEGYIHNGSKWVKASDGMTPLGNDGKFSSENYNSTPGKDVSDNISPTSENDAARINWGGDWRMPTFQEFKDLYGACGGTGRSTSKQPETLSSDTPDKGIYWLDKDQNYISEYTGVAGLLFVDDDGDKLFFPAAGYSNFTSHLNPGSSGAYWSSSWSGTGYSFALGFSNSNIDLQSNNSVWSGLSIRPVSD